MTVIATELWQLSAGELAAAIRSRKASCREVVEAHLRRIEAVNPAVNAVVVVLGDQALDAADAADRAVAAGDELGPLHVSRSPSRGSSTWPARRPPRACGPWPRRTRPGTRPPSSGSRPPARSRSAAPTWPPSGVAGTARASCGARR